MRSDLSVLALVAVGMVACSSSTPAPSASIEVDRATCESGLTTLATFDGTGTNYAALAVAPDGTVFVTKQEVAAGVLATPPSGGPAQLVSDYGGAAHAWVDGGTLWLASLDGSLRSVPTTGGSAVVVGQIPGAPDPSSDNLLPLAGGFAFDESHLYLTAMRYGGAELEVWRIARQRRGARDIPVAKRTVRLVLPTVIRPLCFTFRKDHGRQACSAHIAAVTVNTMFIERITDPLTRDLSLVGVGNVNYPIDGV
jgi:hypothetical protein